MSKQPFGKSSLLATLLLVIIALLTVACQTSQKGRKPSIDWSRSLAVGVLVRGDIDMVAGRQGEQPTHLVWLQEEDGRQPVHYLQLDASANPLVDHNLDLPEVQLRYPQIVETAGPNLHLVWSSRHDDQREWDLQYGQISPAGDLTGETKQLVPADQNVNDFTIAPDGQGGLYVVWEVGSDGSLYGAQVSSTGDVIQEPTLLARQGESPYLASKGSDLYLVWFDDGDVRYAEWPEGRLAEVEGARVAAIALDDVGQTLDGPVLGVSGDWAYVLWSIFSSSGLQAGTAATEYVVFPKDAPTLTSGQMIMVSSAEETPYAPYESAYQISQLAPPASIMESSDLVRQPQPTSGRGDELAVAVTLKQESRLDSIVQVGLLLFKNGAFAGYQMAGKTEAFSQEPVLARDETGNLYMAWREGGRGGVASYALTTAEGRNALDRISGGDVAGTALGGGIEAIVGILFFPLAGFWILPGLLIVGLWHLRRGDEDQFNVETVVVLLLAIIVSQSVKLSFLPLISTYVPFSAWVDISPRWQEPLRVLVPIFTMGIGLLVAFLMRRRNPSALAFFFWFIAVDALLTLAIYGVSFLGV